MIIKLEARDNGTDRQSKSQICQIRRGQSGNFYDSHNYQNRYRSNSRDRRIQFSGQSRGRPRYEQNYTDLYDSLKINSLENIALAQEHLNRHHERH